jgi:hypothetical protein
MEMSTSRQHVHELSDLLPPAHLAAVEGLLESIIDPVRAALEHAPFDDEPVTQDERRDIAEAHEWLKHNKPIPMEQVLADLGLDETDLRKPMPSKLKNG